jgi:hypothetical protein
MSDEERALYAELEGELGTSDVAEESTESVSSAPMPRANASEQARRPSEPEPG